jgi:hypothetical protein
MLVSLALLVGAVAPARGDSRICTPESRGCASFRHAGNIFDVCDYALDGESVAVQTGSRRIVAVNYWGPLRFNGCRRWHVRAHNGHAFKYRVCLATHARPGGKRIKLERFFCSRFVADIA